MFLKACFSTPLEHTFTKPLPNGEAEGFFFIIFHNLGISWRKLPSQEIAVSQQSRGPWKTGRATKVLGRTGSTLKQLLVKPLRWIACPSGEKRWREFDGLLCYVLIIMCFFIVVDFMILYIKFNLICFAGYCIQFDTMLYLICYMILFWITYSMLFITTHLFILILEIIRI